MCFLPEFILSSPRNVPCSMRNCIFSPGPVVPKPGFKHQQHPEGEAHPIILFTYVIESVQQGINCRAMEIVSDRNPQPRESRTHTSPRTLNAASIRRILVVWSLSFSIVWMTPAGEHPPTTPPIILHLLERHLSEAPSTVFFYSRITAVLRPCETTPMNSAIR